MATGYRQIANDLRKRIDAGDLRAGSPLPSEAELMGGFGVSRQTARRAFAVLEADGKVVVQHGVGRFVAGATPHRAPAASPTKRVTKAETVAAALRGQISSGALARGATMPSEAEVATAHAVGRGTARRAFAMLEAEGLVENRPGMARRVTA